MSAYVLDTGALIALENDDRSMWALLLAGIAKKIEVRVPTTALAQVWRGAASQAMLSRVLAQCSLAQFDPLARAVGELCGRTGTSDLCDAHVALVAAQAGGWLCTSDPDDMNRLLASCRTRHRPMLVRC